MKTRTATIISIGSILLASGAALAINTNIFRGTSALADTDQTSLNATLDSLNIAEVSTTTTPSTQSNAPTQPTASTDIVYDVPGVGVVTLAQSGDTLSVVDAAPSDGYDVKVKQSAGAIVEVEFEGNPADYVFRAKVVAGSIVTDISSHTFPKPGGNGVMPVPSERHGEHHDDDDREEHHDNDHEREDEGNDD